MVETLAVKQVAPALETQAEVQKPKIDFSALARRVSFDDERQRTLFSQALLIKTLNLTPREVQTLQITTKEDRDSYVSRMTAQRENGETVVKYLKIVSKLSHKRTSDDRISDDERVAQAEYVVTFMHDNLGPTSDETTPFMSVENVFENADYYGYLAPEYEVLSQKWGQTPDYSQVVRVINCLDNVAVMSEQQGMVHMDLSPDNLYLKADGTCVVGDIDRMGNTHEPLTIGRFGAVGNPWYMAPETSQTLDDDEPTNDTVSTIYTVGVIIYETFMQHYALPYEKIKDVNKPHGRPSDFALGAMRGQNNFEPEYQPVARIFFAEDGHSELSVKLEAMDAVLAKALAPRDQRYQTADEFFEALAKVMNRITPAEYALLWQDGPVPLPRQVKTEQAPRGKEFLRRFIDRFRQI